MAPSVSKEHLIRGSDPSLWGLSAYDGGDETQRLSTRVWTLVNCKLFNTVIIILVLIETLVIAGQLLIDYDLIQDPSLHYHCINGTNVLQTNNSNTNSSLESDSTSKSPNLLITKVILTYSSLILVSIFFVEILLRIYSGRSKLIVEPFELFDTILVIVVFALQLIFFLKPNHDENGDGRSAALLIVTLRFWRINKFIQTLVEESQQKLTQILNVCEKEKNHAEHKIDILILKVEDLEHEVAYLKEKLKKTVKENSSVIQQLINGKNKKIAKRTHSNHSTASTSSYCPCGKNGQNIQSQYQYAINKYASVQLEPYHNHHDESLIDMVELSDDDLDSFAKKLAQSITVDVMSTVLSRNEIRAHNSFRTSFIKAQPSTTDESGYNSRGTVSSNNTSPASTYPHSNNFNHRQSNGRIESDPYFLSDQLNGTSLSSNHKAPIIDSFNAAHLNEELEIERSKKVDFTIDVDIPMNSL